MKLWLTRTARRCAARPWLSIVVVVALAGGGIAAYLLSIGDATSSAAPQLATRLVSVSTGTVREAVSTTGTLTPGDEEDVSFAASARIVSVRVTQGQKVVKGQILGTIDTLSLKSSLAQAQANLANARSTLASAEDNDSIVAAQLTADKAGVATAKSAVAAAKKGLAAATLRAPLAGVVAEVNVAVGDQSTGSTSGGSSPDGTKSNSSSSSSSSTSSPSADFVIIGMRKWLVSATVDDTEVGLIARGDQAQISTDNVSGMIFGTVSAVSVLSSSTSGAASYPVNIAITGTPSGLHDGASATVSIIYRQVSNVLTVPTTAVHRDSSSTYVYVAKNGVKTKSTITTGLASGDTTQVKSGLRSGQQVYVETVTRGSTQPNRNSNSTRTFPGGGYLRGGGNFPGSGNFPGAGGNVPAGTGNGTGAR